MSDFYEKLCLAAGKSPVKREEPMSRHTTFRVGGPARYFVSPAGEKELAAVLALCREEGMPFYILGNGSNLLVSDGGYDGVMISMEEGFSGLELELVPYLDLDTEDVFAAAHYHVGAGVLLSRIAKAALEDGMTGLEFAAGIPGTLGGAVVMNAGAYGGEIKDVLVSVRVMDCEGRIFDLEAGKLELGYRRSIIPEKQYIVLSAVLSLQQGEEDAIRGRMEELAAKRREKQPLEYPSAGSTFKRPAGYFAGKLIEDAGFRGYRHGGAAVSAKHCGFVINEEQATAEDILSLCRIVQKKVRETAGVELELEIKLVGWK